LAVRKYGIPTKEVGCQLLLFRQLQVTPCTDSLVLSRAYNGTPSQRAAVKLPLWDDPISTEGDKMVISYSKLVQRMEAGVVEALDLKGGEEKKWVEILGFQTATPLSDFRSGNVLSLILTVLLLELHPNIVKEFVKTSLPYALCSIHCCVAVGEVLGLKKEKVEVLVSQKSYWKLFSNPMAILHLHKAAMTFALRIYSSEKRSLLFDFEPILHKVKTAIIDCLEGCDSVETFEERVGLHEMELIKTTALNKLKESKEGDAIV